MSVLTQREADIKELLKAVEKIEEENLLLKEVAAQKLPFSSDNTIEINVNQIVQFPGVIKVIFYFICYYIKFKITRNTKMDVILLELLCALRN